MSNNEVFKTIFKVNHADGSGSSFYYKKYNIFVTNYHVVSGFKEVAIQDEDKNSYLASVIMVNPTKDIAFLKAEGDFSNLPEIALSEVEECNIGQKINVAGYPFGMPFTVTEGIVSAPKQLMNNNYYIQTDAAVNPGNSGGPMFNDKNELIGITVSKFNNADNMGFGIPVKALKEILTIFDQIDLSRFNVKCDSCDTFITEKTDYCPSCGNRIADNIFDDYALTPLAGFVEDSIKQMGVNPILARVGYEYWNFYMGSSFIRLFVFNKSYLFCTSPINILPKKDIEPVLNYILGEEIKPYQFGLSDNQIYISYRAHLSDILGDEKETVKKNLVGITKKADMLDNLLHDEYSCDFSEYSKNK